MWLSTVTQVRRARPNAPLYSRIAKANGIESALLEEHAFCHVEPGPERRRLNDRERHLELVTPLPADIPLPERS